MIPLYAIALAIFCFSVICTFIMYEKREVHLINEETRANNWMVWHINHPVPVKNIQAAIHTMEMHYNSRP